ncbi:MAG: hypothetical protein FWD36_06465 [Treponema sp.]|nr:hypothetical protein [Treponema sp.]
MKQTVTIEIANNAVLQILRNLAAMSLVKFTEETPRYDEQLTARLNEIYSELDSSIDPFVVAAQAEVLEGAITGNDKRGNLVG